jgi:hypothetical protein
VGRRGVKSSFKLFLPVFATHSGGGEGIRGLCPHPTASRFREFYTWRERDIRTRTRNPPAELGRGEKGRGEKIVQILITK